MMKRWGSYSICLRNTYFHLAIPCGLNARIILETMTVIRENGRRHRKHLVPGRLVCAQLTAGMAVGR